MTSEQRVAEWAEKFHPSHGLMMHEIDALVGALIASVRAEAIEECCKLLDERSNTCAKKFPPTVAGHMCQALDVAAQMLRDRALVKERKP